MYQKRHRTTFNQYQLNVLEEAFRQNSYPCPSLREALALKIQLDASRIQVWFQNRRAKHKKQVSQAMRCFSEQSGIAVAANLQAAVSNNNSNSSSNCSSSNQASTNNTSNHYNNHSSLQQQQQQQQLQHQLQLQQQQEQQEQEQLQLQQQLQQLQQQQAQQQQQQIQLQPFVTLPQIEAEPSNFQQQYQQQQLEQQHENWQDEYCNYYKQIGSSLRSTVEYLH